MIGRVTYAARLVCIFVGSVLLLGAAAGTVQHIVNAGPGSSDAILGGALAGLGLGILMTGCVSRERG